MSRSIIPIILIITAALVGFFQVKPVYEEMRIVKSKVQNIEEALQKTKEISLAAEDLKSKIKSIPYNDLNKLENVILPDDIDQIRFLNMLNSIASKNNLFLEGLSVSEEDNSVAKNNTSAENSSSNNKLNKLKFSFSVSTDYDTFKKFLNNLEKSMALMEVENIEISVPSADSESVGPVQYSYKVDLITYWMK